MKKIPYRNLYDMLQSVKARPSMWVVNFDLRELETMCHGYGVALKVHEKKEFGTDFNTRFREFIRNRGYRLTEYGWAHSIRKTTSTNKQAYMKFFKLLTLYHEKT